MVMARSAALAALALAVSPATAFFLMPCWPIMTERLDPIVNPGSLSSHVHQIAGGDGFAPAMDYNDTQAASCTTCFVKGDHSNYWIPAMYYQHQNGSFERVPQVGSASMYYFNEPVRLGPGETMETFPEGLRMLAGNPDKRTPGTDAASLAINYKCLDYAGVPTDSKTFPTKNCPDGVRAEVTYPSCWDGKNLDSADHKSHMAYPTGTFESGACPKDHPHHMVTLKVEFIFDTNTFKDMWYGSSQPFVWSSGDTTGYGLHADYVMGWDHALLESAVNQCFDIYGVLANCAPFDGQLPPTQDTFANPGTCTLKTMVEEDVGGVVPNLPGCNEVGTTPGKIAGCQDNAKLLGNWAGSGASSVVASVLPSASNSASSPASAASSSPSSIPAAASPSSSAVAASTVVNSNPYSYANPNPYSETYSHPHQSSAPIPITVSALGVSSGAFYAQQINTASPSPSSASDASPSISISVSSSPSEPTGTGTTKIVTVTDLVTETEWTTISAPIATATAIVAGRDLDGGSGVWRREIGDHGHRHGHIRPRNRRGPVKNKVEQEEK